MARADTMQAAVQRYLEERRRLGFALKSPGTELMRFARFRFIANFLDHLERERGNSPRSRNIRLAALRSFLKFAARRDLASLSVIEQALAVPMKRFERKMVGFLTREQMLAAIDVPTTTWLGQRDHLLLTLMSNTGARVSEIIGVRVVDVVLGTTSCVRLHGKGRKQCSLPLWKLPTCPNSRIDSLLPFANSTQT